MIDCFCRLRLPEPITDCTTSPTSDLLVLFTDGISDARDATGAALGETRVLDVVRARRHDAPTRVVDGVFSLLEGHMSGAAPADDQAIVVLRS